jgi:hypothetical protein
MGESEMVIKTRTKRPDKYLRQIIKVLEQYNSAHPQARIEIYRHNTASVRIRIIDPDFKARNWVQREEEIWPLLEKLPEDVVSDIGLLLLFTPEEASKSLASMEFDEPIPSRL